MPTTKKSKRRKARSRTVPVIELPVPKPTTEVVTEKTYVTTEPEVETRKPGTLAQALTEPTVAVVKPKSRVRKEVVPGAAARRRYIRGGNRLFRRCSCSPSGLFAAAAAWRSATANVRSVSTGNLP